MNTYLWFCFMIWERGWTNSTIISSHKYMRGGGGRVGRWTLGPLIHHSQPPLSLRIWGWTEGLSLGPNVSIAKSISPNAKYICLNWKISVTHHPFLAAVIPGWTDRRAGATRGSPFPSHIAHTGAYSQPHQWTWIAASTSKEYIYIYTNTNIQVYN